LEAGEALCVAGQWHLRIADTTFVRRATSLMRRKEEWATELGAEPQFCRLILEVATERSGTRSAQLDTLDSILQTGQTLRRSAPHAAQAVSRLLNAAGQPARALATSRRRGAFGRWPYYLATSLREEAGYALSIADTTSAVCALDRYLALRIDPEPSQLADRRRIGALRRQLADGRRSRCDE
jgi:hypothetical protein